MNRPLRKRFGQHILNNQNTIADIVNAIRPRAKDTLVEIGPGRGAITLPVLKLTGHLHAIEIDRDFVKEITAACRGMGELIIHPCDVLDFDFSKISHERRRIRLFGNLPYNISTPLLFQLLAFSDFILDMHFMLQKEVAERIVAAAGDHHYSRLSLMIQTRYEAANLFDISPDQFTPPPKVNSSFIRLTPNDNFQNQIKDPVLFDKIVKNAFQQRRKTIKNGLSGLASEPQLIQAGIQPIHRPQEIAVQQYIALSNILTTASDLNNN